VVDLRDYRHDSPVTTGYSLTSCVKCLFSKTSFVCLCSQSVRKAHDSMRSGRVYLAHGDLLDVSINRSPTAYLANPAAERAKYVREHTHTHTHRRTHARARTRAHKRAHTHTHTHTHAHTRARTTHTHTRTHTHALPPPVVC
jgi:hypothetical protein